jgi:hypothetical protein
MDIESRRKGMLDSGLLEEDALEVVEQKGQHADLSSFTGHAIQG